MVGLEGDAYLAELLGEVSGGCLNPAPCEFCEDLLPGRVSDVHACPGRLSHGGQRLLEGCPLAGVGDVNSRLAVEIIRLGLHLEDASAVFDGGYRHPQPVGRYGDGAVKRRVAGDYLAVDAYRF